MTNVAYELGHQLQENLVSSQAVDSISYKSLLQYKNQYDRLSLLLQFSFTSPLIFLTYFLNNP